MGNNRGKFHNAYWIILEITTFFCIAAFVMSVFEFFRVLHILESPLFSFLPIGDFYNVFFTPLSIAVIIGSSLSLLIYSYMAYKIWNCILDSTIILLIIPIISIQYSLLMLLCPGLSSNSHYILPFIVISKALLYMVIFVILLKQIRIETTIVKKSRLTYETMFDSIPLRIGKFVLKYYYQALIAMFNILALLVYKYSIHIASSSNYLDIKDILLKTFPLLFPLAPLYSSFLIGFNEKDEDRARLLSFISGGFFSIINFLVSLRFWHGYTYLEVMTPFLLCLLILGCFMGRESGIMGFKWKKKIESYEKSENERKAAQRFTRYYG